MNIAPYTERFASLETVILQLSHQKEDGMTEAYDPRTRGFNYGPGWGPSPKPPVYAHAVRVAYVLGQEATKMSAKAWALEMAIRDVRLACTGVEKAVAVKKLEAELGKYLPAAVA